MNPCAPFLLRCLRTWTPDLSLVRTSDGLAHGALVAHHLPQGQAVSGPLSSNLMDSQREVNAAAHRTTVVGVADAAAGGRHLRQWREMITCRQAGTAEGGSAGDARDRRRRGDGGGICGMTT